MRIAASKQAKPGRAFSWFQLLPAAGCQCALRCTGCLHDYPGGVGYNWKGFPYLTFIALLATLCR
jgi:hypothetical protein